MSKRFKFELTLIIHKKADLAKLEGLCRRLAALGYREMPAQMYLNWLFELRTAKNPLDSVRYRPKRFPKPDSLNGLPVLTLTDGYFDEFPDWADSTRMAGVVFDLKKKKIAGIVHEPDSIRRGESWTPSRWLSTDPIHHPYQSPYAAFDGNPIFFVDPNGTTIDWYRHTKTGEYQWFEGSEKRDGFVHLGENSVQINNDINGNAISADIYFKQIKHETIDLNSDRGSKFRMMAAEGGGIESGYGLLIISASIENRLDASAQNKFFFGGTKKSYSDLFESNQYNAAAYKSYADINYAIDAWHSVSPSKGYRNSNAVNEYLMNVYGAMDKPDLKLEKNGMPLSDARKILGYAHNGMGEGMFGSQTLRIEFKKYGETHITDVNGHILYTPPLRLHTYELDRPSLIHWENVR